jgi:hypothetical protein
VLDNRGKILILAPDAVSGPERATHPSPPSVGQVHGEHVGKRTSELHHVLRRVYATVQQDHARPPAQTPKADPRAVGGHDRPCRNNLCFVSHDGLDAIHLTNRCSIEQRPPEPTQLSASTSGPGLKQPVFAGDLSLSEDIAGAHPPGGMSSQVYQPDLRDSGEAYPATFLGNVRVDIDFTQVGRRIGKPPRKATPVTDFNHVLDGPDGDADFAWLLGRSDIRLTRMRDTQQAVALYKEASELTRNLAERRYLEQRAHALIGESQT